MTVLEKIIEKIIEQVGCTADDISEESTFTELMVDSIDLIEILMMTELEFGISIQDDDALKCRTVGEFVELVESKTIDFKK